MWRYLDIFHDKFLLPHYIVRWDRDSKSLRKRTGKELKYFAFCSLIAVVHFVLGAYYQIKTGLSTDENPTKVPRDMLLLMGMLIIGLALHTTAYTHTLAFNQGKFIQVINLMCEFQPVLEGNLGLLSLSLQSEFFKKKLTLVGLAYKLI
jgi:hypothetical protein